MLGYILLLLLIEIHSDIDFKVANIQDTVFSNINLEDTEWTEYNKEYYVTIDKDYEISVEPAWHEKSEWRDACYFGACDGIALIHSDANSKILEVLDDCECYEFSIDDDFECDGRCKECAIFDYGF